MIKLKSLIETKKLQNEAITSYNEVLTIDEKLRDILMEMDDALGTSVGSKSYEKTAAYKKWAKAHRDFFVNKLDTKYVTALNNSLDELVKFYSNELNKRTEKLNSDLQSEVNKIKSKLK